MVQKIAQAVAITAKEDRSTSGTLHGSRFTRHERLKRAIGTWISLWLLAAAAVAIPIAHFVLVPLLLVAGPVLAYWRYRTTEQLSAVEGICPLCRHALILAADTRTPWPYWDLCPHCRGNIQLAFADSKDVRHADRQETVIEEMEPKR